MARRDVLHDLEKMQSEDVYDYLDEISCEQALDSECDGDSDADDALPVSRPSTSRTKNNADLPTRKYRIENDDSDDSVGDPEYVPPIKRARNFEDLHYSSSETEDEVQNIDYNNSDYSWVKNAVDPQQFASANFSEPFGPAKPVNIACPVDIFSLFFTEDVINNIITQSNLYAQQKNVDLNLTPEEFRAFLGVLIIMGFHKLPSLRLYWSSDINMRVERVAEIFSLKRFLKVLRYLHINDNDKMPKNKSDPNFDKLFKIRPLLTELQKSFSENFFVSRNVSVDESMVAFKGRSAMKQYMPMKPIKRGFKVWVAACSETGYVCNFKIYEGKTVSENDSFGLGAKTVLDMTNSLRNKPYCIYFDNFFSSFPLFKKMLSHGLFCCGTMRVNKKGFPANLRAEKKMEMGDYDYVMCDDISVVKWKDRGRKCVLVGSTMHNPSEIVTVTRRNKQGEEETVQCPKAIKDYNQYMGGVDLFDQLHSCYNVSWKSRKWYMKIIYYLIDAAIVNSYKMYETTMKLRTSKEKPLTHLTFRSILANELIGQFTSRLKRGSKIVIGSNKMKKLGGRAVSVENTMRLSDVGKHMPIKGTSRRCAYCSTRPHPKRSSVACSNCKVALCLPCFPLFHNKNV